MLAMRPSTTFLLYPVIFLLLVIVFLVQLTIVLVITELGLIIMIGWNSLPRRAELP